MIKIIESIYRKQHDAKLYSKGLGHSKEEVESMSEAWKAGKFPEKMLMFFQTYLKSMSNRKDNITFFDVGAAEGCYSAQIARYFDKFNIVAFEPERARLNQYQENLEYFVKDLELSNYTIQVYERLVTDGLKKTETLRHYVCDKTGGGAGSSRICKIDRPNRISVDLKYETTCLDDFVDEFDKVDVIKIDVEGAELLVLAGSQKFLEKHRPFIFLEIHSHPDNGSILLSDVQDLMRSFPVKYNFRLIEKHSHIGLSYYMLTPEPHRKNEKH
jgi:FkbM family methyltransferase